MNIDDQHSERIERPRVPAGKIVLQVPPELEPSDGASTVLTSLVPMLGSVSAIVMMLMTNSGLTGLLTGGMFMVSSLGFVAVNGIRQRSQRIAKLTASRRDYLAYLADLRKTVRSAGRRQRNAALWTAPDPQALAVIAEEPMRRWERNRDDDDYLFLRVGTWEVPLCITLEAPELPPLAQLDPVSASASHRFMMAHQTMRNMPNSQDFTHFKRIEVLGDQEPCQALVRSLICQAAVWHAPEDVRIMVLTSPDQWDAWSWVEQLPHAAVPQYDVEARKIGTTLLTDNPHEVDALIGDSVTERNRFTGNPYNGDTHVLVVNDGFDMSMLARETRLFSEGGVEGVTVIDLPESWDDLDEDNVLRIHYSQSSVEEGLNIVENRDRDTVEVFSTVLRPQLIEPDALSIREAQNVAHRLARVPLHAELDEDSSQSAARKRSSELPDLLGIKDIRHIDFSHLWAYHEGRDRLNVPIGLHDDLTVAMLDLKEMSQHGMGPHGVLVGATGSGKSEVLRTLVLSLALTHSPDQLNFVLIDFKGGATFAGMDGMPHISSIITNLGREASLVDRMEDALDGEINRRQELLRDAGNLANITEYEEARVNGGRSDLEPLPSLVIVVDEFSELLKAKEDIVQSFVRIGAVGRSLGIHLLIASQRLEQGKLRGLDEHLSYRIGLKTFSASESRAVLGVTDAFELPSLPGIGFLKTPSGTMSRFRASYVSGVPAALEATGAPTTTFEYAVEQMRGKGRPAHVVWLPPLVTPNTLDEFMPDLQVVPGLGLVSPQWRKAGTLMAPCMLEDRPREQKREVLALDLSGAGGHVAVVGVPLSGKSTLLRTIVTSLALSHSPLETQFFVVDCGGGTFTGLESLVHVAGVAAGNEEEKIRRTIAEVAGLINRRELFFKEKHIDGMDTYRRQRAQGKADDGYGDVFLVIDGWGNFRADYESFEEKVQQIAARGLAFGVHVMLSANRWMEIRTNMTDLIGTKVELRLGDPTDSRIGRVAKTVPTGMPGRGISMNGLHVMAALPRIDGDHATETLTDGVANLVQRVNAAWGDRQSPKLRLLPEVLPYDDFARALTSTMAEADLSVGSLYLGLNEEDLSPVFFDMNAMPHCYVFGDTKSGKSSFLRLVAREIERSYPADAARIFMVDYRRANLAQLKPSHAGMYMTSEAVVSDTVMGLVDILKSRLPGPDVTPEQLRNRSWWTGKDIFLLVDDYDLVAPKSGANPLLPIVPYLAQASDIGLHVVVARRAGGASRAMYDPVLQSFQDLGMTGILLDGDPNEGQLIGRVKPKRAVPGLAQVVTRDSGLFVAQFAYPELTE